MAFNRLFPWEERLIAENLASGNKEDAVFEVAKAMTRIGQYTYDSKLRSLFESNQDAKQLAQYTSWWRGYTMRVWRDLRSMTGDDWFNPKPAAQRINAAKSLLALSAHSAVSTLIYNIVTGRDPQDEDGSDRWRSRIKGLARTDPYAPSGVAGFQTLLSPINMGRRMFQDDGGIQLPSQVLQAMYNHIDGLYIGSYQAADAFVRYQVAVSTGDKEDMAKAEKSIVKAMRKAATNGKDYFRSYYISAARTFRLMDIINPEDPGYSVENQARNHNWLRWMAEKALGKDGRDVLPLDYDPSEVEPQSRSTWGAIQSLMFLSNTPRPEEK